MSDTIAIPLQACRLRIPDAEVALQEPAQEGRKPRFKMQVNSGIPMSHGYFGTLAVNLEGIEWQGKHVAALLDHDASRRVGYTTKLYLDDESGLVAEGIMLSNADAMQVRTDSQEGFPFQASCYLVANAVETLDHGASAEVNGHAIEGPATIFQQSTLREVTFTALGADPNTASDASLSDVTEVVHASLSKTGTTMTDNDKTIEPTTVAAEVDAEAVRLEAHQAATERVSYILELAADCQIDLARQLIKDGVNERESSLRLAADAKDRERQQSPSTEAMPHTVALGAPELPAQDDLPEGEDKWRADWKVDAQLRAEFGGKEAVWMSWNNNKHRCRKYGNVTPTSGESQ